MGLNVSKVASISATRAAGIGQNLPLVIRS
jgi:hypothetical protein